MAEVIPMKVITEDNDDDIQSIPDYFVGKDDGDGEENASGSSENSSVKDDDDREMTESGRR